VFSCQQTSDTSTPRRLEMLRTGGQRHISHAGKGRNRLARFTE